MKEIISFCGLDCSACDAFQATISNDEQRLAETARLWADQFKIEVKPEDVKCDGCRSGSSRLSSYCRACEIRQCGTGKALENCAHCAEFACEKLEKVLKMAPEAAQRLEGIRSAIPSREG